MGSYCIDQDRGCWSDHGGETFLLRDVLRIREPVSSRAVPYLGWVVYVEVPHTNYNYETPAKVVSVRFGDPRQAWDFYHALSFARGAATLPAFKGSLWGPVPKP
jgi:hypothetical protein